MPTPRINVGAYGKAGDRANIGKAVAGTIQGIEGEIRDRKKYNQENLLFEQGQEDREQAKKDAIYNREEAFYVANDIPDAGLGYESGLEDVFRSQKKEMARIAGKGADATDEERAKLRQFTAQIQKVSGGQNHLKQVLKDYKTSMDTDGKISSSTPKDIASLLKDLNNGGGDFKPVVGEDGTIRLQGTTSDGYPVDYSYDQLSSVKFSPKYDLNAKLKSDKELIGNVKREYGDKTFTNTPSLINNALNETATTTLSNQHTLFEIGAELGFDADYREANPDTYKQDIHNAYVEKLRGAIGSSITEDENTSTNRQTNFNFGGSGSQKQYTIDTGIYTAARTNLAKGYTPESITSLNTLVPDKVRVREKDGNLIVENLGSKQGSADGFNIYNEQSFGPKQQIEALNYISRVGGVSQGFLNNQTYGNNENVDNPSNEPSAGRDQATIDRANSFLIGGATTDTATGTSTETTTETEAPAEPKDVYTGPDPRSFGPYQGQKHQQDFFNKTGLKTSDLRRFDKVENNPEAIAAYENINALRAELDSIPTNKEQPTAANRSARLKVQNKINDAVSEFKSASGGGLSFSSTVLKKYEKYLELKKSGALNFNS